MTLIGMNWQNIENVKAQNHHYFDYSQTNKAGKQQSKHLRKLQARNDKSKCIDNAFTSSIQFCFVIKLFKAASVVVYLQQTSTSIFRRPSKAGASSSLIVEGTKEKQGVQEVA